MADIELVIQIPEEMYKWVNDVNKFFDDYGTGDFVDLIKNGKPLDEVFDEIRTEIERLTITEGGEDYTRTMAELYSLKIKILQIIDKYRAESEEMI